MLNDPKRIVLLVDNKRRDLPVAALIGHYVRQLGAELILEPIEAYRSVLAAYRPDMIIFNHLQASHLSNFSGRLKEMGVKVAVLPNEALAFNPEVMRFLSHRYNERTHVDLFLAWNSVQKECLLREGFDGAVTRIETVGNPRFDFYFEPWNRLSKLTQPRKKTLPRVLLCTNFILADCKEAPKEHAERVFAIWKKHIKSYENFWSGIESNHRGRAKVLKFYEALLRSGKFEVIMRPHPGEFLRFYTDWVAQLPEDLRSRLFIEHDQPISGLIMDCDLEISCETCTTALESWVAGKPTIKIINEKHPMFYHEQLAGTQAEVAEPELIVAEVERQLADPSQPEFKKAREELLATWLASPKGDSCERIARAVVEVASTSKPNYQRHLTLEDHRRGLKLRLLQRFNLPVNYDPLLAAKKHLQPERFRAKSWVKNKTITQSDIREANERIASCLKPLPEGPGD